MLEDDLLWIQLGVEGIASYYYHICFLLPNINPTHLVKTSTKISFILVYIFRVFDQYEIDIEMKKHRHSYLGNNIFF